MNILSIKSSTNIIEKYSSYLVSCTIKISGNEKFEYRITNTTISSNIDIITFSGIKHFLKILTFVKTTGIIFNQPIYLTCDVNLSIIYILVECLANEEENKFTT